MKSLICYMIALSMMVLSLGLTGCVTSGNKIEDSTINENFSEHDSEYSRVIYLNTDESYDLKQQLIYEGVAIKDLTLTTSGTSFTINGGVITACSNIDNFSSEELTIQNNGETTTILVHVMNKAKYGEANMGIDVGRLYGKKVVFFGDSITHNWAKYPNGDKYMVETDSLGYNYIPRLNNYCKFSSITNCAWSGGTVAYLPSSNERFTWKSLPGSVDDNEDAVKNADYIFIFYGTNDLTEQVPIGNEDDTMVPDGKTDYSFYAGLNYSLSKIRSLNGNAKVVVLNIMVRDPINMGSIKITSYNQAILNGANKYMTKHLNMFKLFNATHLKEYFNDGLHPNDKGYDKITEYILSGI